MVSFFFAMSSLNKGSKPGLATGAPSKEKEIKEKRHTMAAAKP